MAVVKGTALWAHVANPNTKYDPCWSIDLIPEDPAVLEEFRSKGYKIKTTDDGAEKITFKRKCENSKGQANKPPKLVDAEKNPISALVGNGSVVNVQYREWATENKYGSFQGLDLQGVQVLDLVEYTAGDGDEFDSYDSESEF